MFSRIFATASPAVPTSQAAGKRENRRTARLPSSSLRCTSMSLRMYAASSVPREPKTSWRRASSSRANASTSAAERCAVGSGLPDGFGTCRRSVVTTLRRLFVPLALGAVTVVGVESVVVPVLIAAVMLLLEVDLTAAGNRRHAGLDMDGVAFRGDRQLPVTQVAYHPLFKGNDTPEADPHPAAGGHQDAGVLTDIQDGSGTVGLDYGSLASERDGTAFPLRDQSRTESFGVEPLGKVCLSPMRLHRVKQPDRAAGPCFSFAPVRDQFVEVCGREDAFSLGIPLDKAQSPGSRPIPQLVAEDDVLPRGGGMDDDHVVQAVEMVSQ